MKGWSAAVATLIFYASAAVGDTTSKTGEDQGQEQRGCQPEPVAWAMLGFRIVELGGHRHDGDGTKDLPPCVHDKTNEVRPQPANDHDLVDCRLAPAVRKLGDGPGAGTGRHSCLPARECQSRGGQYVISDPAGLLGKQMSCKSETPGN